MCFVDHTINIQPHIYVSKLALRCLTKRGQWACQFYLCIAVCAVTWGIDILALLIISGLLSCEKYLRLYQVCCGRLRQGSVAVFSRNFLVVFVGIARLVFFFVPVLVGSCLVYCSNNRVSSIKMQPCSAGSAICEERVLVAEVVALEPQGQLGER